MRAIGRPLPMFRRCCVVQQCRLASYSVVIQGVRGVKDDLVKQFANKAAKVVAFRRMQFLNGEEMPICVVTYGSETDRATAVKTLNGQKITDDQLLGVLVEETNKNAHDSGLETIEWGRTAAHPGSEGRTVMLAHHRQLDMDTVLQHIKKRTGANTECEISTSFAKGISLVQFANAKEAQAAIEKLDKTEIAGYPCRAVTSKNDWKPAATRV
eukprot:Filipodium_phascolosomae@DN2771_c1_g3_i1.p1